MVFKIPKFELEILLPVFLLGQLGLILAGGFHIIKLMMRFFSSTQIKAIETFPYKFGNNYQNLVSTRSTTNLKQLKVVEGFVKQP